MNHLFEYLFLLDRLDRLIRTKATGTVEDLAARLETSKRNTERLLATLRDMGFPVAYDKERKTYYYSEAVKIRIEIVVGGDALLSIKGGAENYFQKKEHTAIFWR